MQKSENSVYLSDITQELYFMNKIKIGFKNCMGTIVRYLQAKTSLTAFSLTLSIFTTVAYHYPFFRAVTNNVDADFNGVLITAGLAIVMLALNFFTYYLILFIGRIVGKFILAFTFLANACCFYFIVTYNTLITDKMMGNFWNTQYSEASGFFTWHLLLYIIFLGVIPCIYLFVKKFEYGKWKRFFANIGIALAAILVAVGINFNNILWIDRNSTEIGSLLMPWSYTINTFRYFNAEKKRNMKELPLPDATITSDSKDVCVLIIGESARRMNFSLYGYEKKTNPLLENENVTALVADAADTYTTAGVKAILSHQPSNKLYEILPNYLYRSGVDVIWRSNNWGEPPVHIEKYYKVKELKEMYPEADSRYDEILLAGLKEEILESDKDKILIILHTSTSHGPTYNLKYPEEFEVFTPVCQTVEASKSNREELINAYDNTIVYTDYLIYKTIELLRDIPQRRSCMMFVSDHGESLGENNLYMHGVPLSVAPAEQIEIPFIVWTSDDTKPVESDDKVGHYHVFHSILSFMDIESPVYERSLDIFANDKE